MKKRILAVSALIFAFSAWMTTSTCFADSVYYAVFKGSIHLLEWSGVGPGGSSAAMGSSGQLGMVSNPDPGIRRMDDLSAMAQQVGSEAAESSRQSSYLLFPFKVDDNGALIASEPSRNCIFANVVGKGTVKLYPMNSNFTVFFTPTFGDKVFTHAGVFYSRHAGAFFAGFAPEGEGLFYRGYDHGIKGYKAPGDQSELPIAKKLSGVGIYNRLIGDGLYDAWMSDEELVYYRPSTIAINRHGPYANSITSWAAALDIFARVNNITSLTNAYNHWLYGEYMAIEIDLSMDGDLAKFDIDTKDILFDGIGAGTSIVEGNPHMFKYNFVTNDGAFVWASTNPQTQLATQGYLARGKQVFTQGKIKDITEDVTAEFAVSVAKSTGMSDAALSGAYSAYRMVYNKSEGGIKIGSWSYDFAGDGTGTVTSTKGIHDLTYTVTKNGKLFLSYTTSSGNIEKDRGIVSKDGGFFVLSDQINGSSGIIVAVKRSTTATAASLKGSYFIQSIFCDADGSNPGLSTSTMTFNGDGTGFSQSSYGTSNFTYAVEPDGSFSLTYSTQAGTEITRHGYMSPDVTCLLVGDPDEAGGEITLALGTQKLEP